MSVQRVLVFKCKVEVDSPDCTSTFFYCDMLIKKKLFIFINQILKAALFSLRVFVFIILMQAECLSVCLSED